MMATYGILFTERGFADLLNGSLLLKDLFMQDLLDGLVNQLTPKEIFLLHISFTVIVVFVKYQAPCRRWIPVDIRLQFPSHMGVRSLSEEDPKNATCFRK